MRCRSLAAGQKYSTTAASLRIVLGRGRVLLPLLLLGLRLGVRGRRGEHGLAHAGVGAAAAEVAGQAVVDVLERGIGIAVEERLGGHDEAGGAETALLGVVLHERGLEGIELVAVAEA